MKKEILVVDDQPGIRLLLQEIFTNEGYQVTAVETGKEALDTIYNGSYDLVMLDYKLPVVDGIQVIQQLEHDNFTTPLIVMSGLAEDIVKELKAYSLVKKVLAKPFNVQEMCTLTKKLLA
ncbi:response regulator [Virgibacillus doumboii]|uniref:response regulator n=1 Tax=Virgibacillus doumboii TaxID=2697503 RepID=UPI0013DF952D|nr:response regulator [Virgibacillus doumboii]